MKNFTFFAKSPGSYKDRIILRFHCSLFCGLQFTRPCQFNFTKIGDILEMQSHAHSQLKHHIPQPLFKLTTSSVSHPPLTSGSYFASPNVNKSASHGHQLNIRPVNSPSSTYFRPNTPRQKEKGEQYHI